MGYGLRPLIGGGNPGESALDVQQPHVDLGSWQQEPRSFCREAELRPSPVKQG